MPRGRLPSGTVATTLYVPESMIERSPETSLVTYSRGCEDSAGTVCGVCSAVLVEDLQPMESSVRLIARITHPCLYTDYFSFDVKFASALPEGLMVTCCSWVPSFSCQTAMVYVPGGRFLISKLPSLAETAKYG